MAVRTGELMKIGGSFVPEVGAVLSKVNVIPPLRSLSRSALLGVEETFPAASDARDQTTKRVESRKAKFGYARLQTASPDAPRHCAYFVPATVSQSPREFVLPPFQ